MNFNLKSILSLFFLLIVQFVFGQVAIIQDPDGWTNVRKSPNAKAEIIYKIKENEVFWFDYEPSDEDQNWVYVHVPKDKFCFEKTHPSFIEGYIHKSKLKPLENMEIYKGTDFSFEYQIAPFDKTNRIIDKQDDKWVTAIDGRAVWGTDGDYPKTIIKDIQVTIEGKPITIHKAFYIDLYECQPKVNIYKNGDTYIVYQWNSDGAGFYELAWVINQSGLQQRLVGTVI